MLWFLSESNVHPFSCQVGVDGLSSPLPPPLVPLVPLARERGLVVDEGPAEVDALAVDDAAVRHREAAVVVVR